MARGSIQFKANKRDKRGGRYYVVLALGEKRKWLRVPDPNTKKHAEQILASKLEDLHAGEYRELKKTTFREFAERWIRDYVEDPNHIKPSTAYAYKKTFETHLLPYFEDYGLVDVTPDLIQGFVSEQSRSGLSPHTIHSRLAPMTRMFKHAIQWGYLRTSPMPQVEKPRKRKRDQVFLSAAQVRALIEAAPEEWKAFFLTAGLTGMRLGELLAMRWKNVDWKAGCYNVRERLYERLFDTPKSETSMRAVDLAPSALDALKVHRAEQNRVKLMLGPDYQDADLVFCQPDGKPIINPRSIRKVLKKALTDAGCPQVRVHDLRHSYASALIAEGAHPRYIQKQLGHASISITMDVYGHLFPEMGQEMAQKIEAHFFGSV